MLDLVEVSEVQIGKVNQMQSSRHENRKGKKIQWKEKWSVFFKQQEENNQCKRYFRKLSPTHVSRWNNGVIR